MKEKVRNLALPVLTVGSTALYAFPSFASGEGVDASSIVTTAVNSIQSDLMSTISDIAPKAIVVVGAVMAIRFGIAFFSKITGAKK